MSKLTAAEAREKVALYKAKLNHTCFHVYDTIERLATEGHISYSHNFVTADHGIVTSITHQLRADGFYAEIKDHVLKISWASNFAK